jgi:hypothetical protein
MDQRRRIPAGALAEGAAMTAQPKWKEIAQLGDVHPIDYGGYFIYEDETGVYEPEGEYLESPDSDDAPEGWTVYRFTLERKKIFEDEETHQLYLVPFRYDNTWPHAVSQYDEWFHKDLAAVAQSSGIELKALRESFCSDDPKVRAWAYREIGQYHGFANLDAYPLQFKERRHIERRYAEKHEYEVVVGNIGQTYNGTDRLTALKKFRAYRELSQRGRGRALGESVTLLRDGDIYKEHRGTVEP